MSRDQNQGTRDTFLIRKKVKKSHILFDNNPLTSLGCYNE